MKVNMVNKIPNGIVWVRTPKCATTTLAIQFEKFCKYSNIKTTLEGEHNIMAPVKYMNLGHLYSGDINWDVVKSQDRLVIGSVRHPLKRFLSHYKHHLREGRYKQYGEDVSSFYLENYDNTHFESFIRTMDNYLTKYLGVGDDTKWDGNLVLEKYDFFTLTENIQETYKKFKKISGYTIEDVDLKENSTKYNLKITDKFLKLFESRNISDYELFDFIIKNYGYEN